MTETRPAAARRRWIRYVIPLVAVVAYALYVQFFVRQEQGLSDIFEILEARGYTANVGLAGTYRPGNVIQTTEAGPDGQERTLASPLLFLRGDKYFAGRAPQASTFTLPELAGRRSASLILEPQALNRFLPKLNMQNTAAVDYSMRLENTRVMTYARADLSGNFARECVNDWQEALGDGDKSSWFAVIVEAVVADALVFEMIWKSNASLEARAALAKEVRQTLAGTMRAIGQAPEVNIEFGTADEKKTVVAAKGLVIVGYRARPMQLSPAHNPAPTDLRAAFAGHETGQFAGRLAILLQDNGGSRRVGLDHKFHTGDRFRFEITSSAPGWIYIFHRSPGEKTKTLWPPQADAGAGSVSTEIRPGRTYIVPPHPGVFVFDDEIGKESFFVAVRSNPPATGPPGLRDTRPRQPIPGPEAQISVRGRIDELSGRGVSYDDGSANAEPYIYFAAGNTGDGTIAAIKFQLRHEN